MKSWAVNVKCGERVDVIVPEGQKVHTTQATLGELVNSSNDTVDLLITVNGEQRIIGTIHSGRSPQHIFSSYTMFKGNFQISHTSKDCSVNVFGYRAALKLNTPYLKNHTPQEEEEIPKMQSGKKRPNESASKTPNTRKQAKSTTNPQRSGKAAGKQKVKIVKG